MRCKNDVQLIAVDKLLLDEGMEMPSFRCVSSDPANFRLLRVQPQAQFSYNLTDGPVCRDPQLAGKCEAALRLAERECADLVLFPEYCVPYSLLSAIARNVDLWPTRGRLWCLPAQGISYDAFFQFLKEAGKIENVVVLDQYCSEEYLEKRYFVNALFYCFTVYQDHEKKLVLLPQLKLHPMRDQEYFCEGTGLTTGNILYYFSGQQERLCLLSLLCADVYRSEITWQKLCAETSTHLILLHPQMNGKPREEGFCRIRREMMAGNDPGLYITCNWAEGTRVTPASAGDGTEIRIGLSWSCIYRKYEAFASYEGMSGSAQIRNDNLRSGICTGLISRRRTAVWFTDSQESIHLLEMEAVCSTGYPVANRFQSLKAVGRYADFDGKKTWRSAPYQFSLQEKLRAEKDLSYLIDELSRSAYWSVFPLAGNHKDEIDHFFALASCLEKDALEIDGNTEVPAAWSLLLEDHDIQNADSALTKFSWLCRGLSNLPPHLQELKGNWNFVYLPANGEKPPANFQGGGQTGKRLIVAFANSVGEARHYMRYLKKHVLPKGEDSEGQYVCVFYPDIASANIDFLPKAQTDVANGSAFQKDTSIIDGGEDCV